MMLKLLFNGYAKMARMSIMHIATTILCALLPCEIDMIYAQRG